MQDKGWFVIPGRQRGDRPVDEQLQGLDGLDVAGRTVLDIGCAEGLIALHLCERGALSVDCLGLIETELQTGRDLCADHPITFHRCDLRENHERAALFLSDHYDVVLLLSIVHKMRDPLDLLRWACARAGDVVAVRVPEPVYTDRARPPRKHDLVAQLSALGFELIASPATCRGEYLAIFNRREPIP